MLQQVDSELSSSLYAEAGQDNTARETGYQKPAKNQEEVLLEESKLDSYHTHAKVRPM